MMSKKAIDAHPANRGVHFILQGKGGVGKSVVASLVCQYLRESGVVVEAIDTDPVNQSFSEYKALGAKYLKLSDDPTKVEPRRFDGLVERLLTEHDAGFVIDNGASTFLPLWGYMIENDVLSMLRDAGRRVLVHTVVTGGQAYSDTVKGFYQLANSAAPRSVVVWKNEFFGPIVDPDEGYPFEASKVAQQYGDRVAGMVTIAKRNSDTFGIDMGEMLTKKLTFAEMLEGTSSLMAKQRLTMVRRDLWHQLEQVGWNS